MSHPDTITDDGKLGDEPLSDEPIAAPARRGRTALISSVAAGVVLAVLIGVLATRDPATSKLADSPLLGRAAPPTSGESLLGGGRFDLADGAGEFTLVNFFATWCVPCRREHPELVTFANRHAVAGDARVVSIVFSDEADDVVRFFEKEGGDWPVIDDTTGRLTTDWGVTGVPESYLVGPDGRVLAKIVGGVDAARLDDLLRRAKAGAGGSR